MPQRITTTSLGRRRLAAGVVLAVVALLATACGGGEGFTVQGVKLVKKGQLTTCTQLPYVPFQFEQSGKIVGFDVDLIDRVAKKLGVTQKLVDTSFENIKTGAALNASKCDVAAAGMTITAERAQKIDYSKPYFNSTQVLMTRKDAGVTSLETVKSKKLKLGSQAGTTGEDYVKAKGFDPKSYETSQAQLDGLRTRQVDVIVLDEPVVKYWLKDPANADFTSAVRLELNEHLGFAVRKGHNPKLVELLNQEISTATKDGSYQRLYETWMGSMPSDALPPAS